MAVTRTVASRAGKRGGIVVEGLDETVRAFTRHAATVTPMLGAIVTRHAAKAAQRMRDRVPVDEGDVLESITSDDRPTIDAGRVYADAGPDPAANRQAFVARFLEYGTVKMPPRPFLGPAADETVPELVRDVKAAVKL